MMTDSEQLALILRQIIEADRKAMDVINGAQDMKRSIEEKTAAEKQKILKTAEHRRQEVLARLQEEQREKLAQRKKEAAKQYVGAREKLKETMDESKSRWVQEITGQITGAGGE